ncbi:hypothetical protein MPTK1_6g01760 [Marchantia polymorpha subsp. ruderalis]|uniref:Uncharacterized protein n=2 Tax=Marchantia polymorpha TaxID=3197 RepID=A0AAF6BMI6_MARPO|nr:hypothetical protein MARPO_0052s0028 [Marchantia polymorpha]BBN13220.1 hypothetical protein Mp_6g01760 [Marchantia polymorpha subsp. ruderalis]|eukprot:PTQ38225.1 hypothetical protein MARPO_0052s0028 [Marchantia polymorpha]
MPGSLGFQPGPESVVGTHDVPRRHSCFLRRTTFLVHSATSYLGVDNYDLNHYVRLSPES